MSMEINTSEQKSFKWKKFLILFGIITSLFIIATIVLAILFGIERNQIRMYQSSSSSSENETKNLCLSSYCLKAANYLLESIDETIDPCENFYQFTCGTWIKNTRIPYDQQSQNAFTQLQTQVIYDIIDLLSTSSTNESIQLNSVINAQHLYNSCIHEEAIEKDGIDGILSVIHTQFNGWPIIEQSNWNESTYNLLDLSVKLSQYNSFPLFYTLTYNDDANSSAQCIYIGQGTLSLGDRNYYLNESTITQAYKKLMKDVISALTNNTLVNDSDIDEIFQFEKSLAQNFYTTVQQRETPVYRLTFGSLFNFMNTSFNYTEYLQRIYLFGNVTLVREDIINVNDLEVLRNISILFDQNRPRTIQNYLIWRFVLNQIDHMPKRFRMMKQEFIKIFSGTAVETSRPVKCATYITDNMGMVVSRLYIKKKFDDYARRESIETVKNIHNVLSEMINGSKWMNLLSKTVAIEKAQWIHERIGYADELNGDNMTDFEQQYAEYKFNSSYIQNILRMLQLNAKKNLLKLHKSVDRKNWDDTFPTTVNAYYRPSFNDITLTAAILQTPFFRKDAPKYLNYGAIGTIIGHELTHAFDNDGRQYDKYGNRIPWWTYETINSFNEHKQCMIEQYNNYTISQINMNINGKQTLSENIADNGGLKEAFYAYQKWSKMNPNVDQKLPSLTKYSEEQMFFMSYGSIWCSKSTDQAALKIVLTDTHSPTEFRILGSTSNFDEFDRVFGYNQTHINPGVFIKKEYIYPLAYYPISTLWLPGPKNIEMFFKSVSKSYYFNFSIDKICYSQSYSHRDEMSKYKQKTVNCTQLLNTYPFIQHICDDHYCYQHFMLNNRTRLYSLKINKD
ncbi:unnamed protein product [Adineta steineri]|uniref:Uncharacterized protein n=1 Tax=Adineta steineri TaxID=433720 RepID=A0A814K2I6_9BILA|nr:unnamed protein product [Adineta steineri]